MKVGVLTLGCKVNLYESEYVMDLLTKKGYEISDFKDVCDVYIINTCTVTNTSDIKSKKMIRRAIRQNPDACVVAMGCFIEANKDYKEQGLDIVIGNKDKSKIVEILDEYFKRREEIRRLYKEEKTTFEDMFITDFKGRTRAFVKIQDGCENFCSYCIIPYVRGKCRSKEFSKVIEEIKELVNNNYKEIVLTGIHTGNYGVDIDKSFAELLKEIVKIKGLERLRISSIEATELNEDVLSVIKNSKIIVDHLHIPIQSGSNDVLKLMNRKYDLDYFENKIKEIRSIRQNISITTDIIVGHPKETEANFLETIKTVKRIGFAKIHVFPYSKREGTKATMMDEQIPENIKKERARQLLKLSKELELKYFEKFIGTKVEVLVETNVDGKSYGHTGNYLYVEINDTVKPDTFVTVQLKDISYPYVRGVLL